MVNAMASVHMRPRSRFFQASFRDDQGRQIMRSTKVTDRAKAMEIALELERLSKGTDEPADEPARPVVSDSREWVGSEVVVSETLKLKVDPPTLNYSDRDEPKVVAEEDPPAPQETKVEEVKVSALAILCMVSALMGFLFFPALAALPLGILALRRIDESQGALEGRHLAITGLCISVVALAVWLMLIAAGLIALELLDGLAKIIFPAPPA